VTVTRLVVKDSDSEVPSRKPTRNALICRCAGAFAEIRSLPWDGECMDAWEMVRDALADYGVSGA
jgi:hypothetical protein